LANTEYLFATSKTSRLIATVRRRPTTYFWRLRRPHARAPPASAWFASALRREFSRRSRDQLKRLRFRTRYYNVERKRTQLAGASENPHSAALRAASPSACTNFPMSRRRLPAPHRASRNASAAARGKAKTLAVPVALLPPACFRKSTTTTQHKLQPTHLGLANRLAWSRAPVCCEARADAVQAAASLDPERGELQPASVSATTAPPAFVRLRGAESCCCSFPCSVEATLRAPASCDAQACSSQNRNATAETPRPTLPMNTRRCVRYAATFPAALRTRAAWRVPARCKGKCDLPT
jgi:hypothetical protein